MTCLECSATLKEDWTTALVGINDLPLEIHVLYCQSCGWVTVQDYRWIDEKDGDNESHSRYDAD